MEMNSVQAEKADGIRVLQSSFLHDGRRINCICLEFSGSFMLFISEKPTIASVLEAAPDDPVDLGTTITYDTKNLFGKEDLVHQLLARRLVERFGKRVDIAVSVPNLSIEDVRAIEDHIAAEILPKLNLSRTRFPDLNSDLNSAVSDLSELQIL